MAKYQKARIETTTKSERLNVQVELPMAELIHVRADLEELCLQIGLKVMQAMIEAEVQSQLGSWGTQKAHRHGRQSGYIVYAGRKLAIQRPRVRSREGQEVPLATYRAFQGKGRLQAAVARQMMRQCSTRNYEGAIEQLAQGYGIKKSCVSRHFKASTAQELKALLERPVPADLLVLIIDGQYFARQCVTVALGVDKKGCKHVLGLWHGATENATVAGALLEDLEARGLQPSHPILVLLDGSKALRKAVQTVLGERAVVQRCRVHKQRNIVEHLPKEAQPKALWRLRSAWEKKDPQEAQKELQRIVQWLESFSPMAARSLREGLEETITLQKLGIHHRLARSLSSTNLIESCFARVESLTHRVSHWQHADMVLRWTAAALLWNEKRFRRLNGCEQIADLEQALKDLPASSLLKAA